MQVSQESECPVELMGYLDKLLRQVLQTCGNSDLLMIQGKPIWIENTKFLLLTSNPHLSYEVWHTPEGWRSDDTELEQRLRKIDGIQRPMSETEIWAVNYLRGLGYKITEPNVLEIDRGDRHGV